MPAQDPAPTSDRLTARTRLKRAVLAGVGLLALSDQKFQFERHGYFVADRQDHQPDHPVFNKITGLKDGNWAK